MAEYIDRAAVISVLSSRNAPWDAVARVKNIPAADVVERKRGEWELFNNSGLGFSHSCSLCNFEVRDRWIDLYNYCPNCGSDNRGEEE